jgi:uncharacterized repeat protein (TIGR01451 family)
MKIARTISCGSFERFFSKSQSRLERNIPVRKPWFASLAALVSMLLLTACPYRRSLFGEFPDISDISPNTFAAGGPDRSVTINGSGFASPQAFANGTPLALSSASGSQIVATIPASMTATPRTLALGVANFLPSGTIYSNTMPVTITNGSGGSPAWNLNLTHTGNFMQGQTGAPFTITATNSGTGPTNSTSVTVSDTIPTGLTATAAAGNGWNCTVTPTTVTCTRTDVLAAGSSYPPITLTVSVATNAPATITNTATISGGGAAQSATGSDTVSVTGPTQTPAWTITKAHAGNFTQGQTGATFTITVKNSGTGPTDGSTKTVMDNIPGTLTGTGASGSGWTCTVTTTMTCTRSDVAAAGASYPPITLTVDVSPSAPAAITNTVSITGGGASGATASDTVTVTTSSQVPDLTITKTHTGNFPQGGTGQYTVTVKNVGTGPTTGMVSFMDTLPTGLTLGSMSGFGWGCTPTNLTCFRSDTLAANSSYPPVTVTVNVAANAPATVTNSVTVSGGGETNTSNNTATDPTVISPTMNNLLSSSYVLYAQGVNTTTGGSVLMLGHAAFNGSGGATSCGFTYNSPSQVLSDAGCTVTYIVDATGHVHMIFATTPTPQTFAFDSQISTSVTNPPEFGIVLSGAAESVNLTGYALQRSPSDFTLADKNGSWVHAGTRGEVNSMQLFSLGSVTFDTMGNGPGAHFDASISGGTVLTTGSTFLNPINSLGCGTTNTQFDSLPSPPFTDISYLFNGTYCVVDSDTIAFTSTDTRSTTQPIHAGIMFRQMPGLTTPDKLSGFVVGWDRTSFGTGPSASNETQLFQFNSDGVSSFTSGKMFQNNAGATTQGIPLTGSTYKMGTTINGRFTLGFNTGSFLIFSPNVTGYLVKPNTGFFISGTATNPPGNVGFGALTPQTGSPFSDSSFGTSKVTLQGTLGPPDFATAWSLVGTYDFSGGVSNFPGTIDFFQGGAFSGNQSINGSFTITDTANGWFGGTLNGLPSGAGAVTGYIASPGAFNYVLTTGPTTSVIITTGIYY